jgi:hypothetical protein
MGKTRHGRGTAWARHAMYELALRKAAIAFISIRMSRIYSYSKVHHSLTDNLHLFKVMRNGLIPVAAQSKMWVCGGSLAGFMSSNLARGIDVSLL